MLSMPMQLLLQPLLISSHMILPTMLLTVRFGTIHLIRPSPLPLVFQLLPSLVAGLLTMLLTVLDADQLQLPSLLLLHLLLPHGGRLPAAHSLPQLVLLRLADFSGEMVLLVLLISARPVWMSMALTQPQMPTTHALLPPTTHLATTPQPPMPVSSASPSLLSSCSSSTDSSDLMKVQAQ